MAVPNMFILYVSDAPASARFYSGLFGMKPVFETSAFIAFDLAGGIQLALWSSGPADSVPSRTSELCLTLEGGPDEIDRTFHDWRAKELRSSRHRMTPCSAAHSSPPIRTAI